MCRCQIYSNKNSMLNTKDQRGWKLHIKNMQMSVASDEILKDRWLFLTKTVLVFMLFFGLERNQMTDRRIQEHSSIDLSIQQSFSHLVPSVWVPQSILILSTNNDKGQIESQQFNTQLKLWQPQKWKLGVDNLGFSDTSN